MDGFAVAGYERVSFDVSSLRATERNRSREKTRARQTDLHCTERRTKGVSPTLMSIGLHHNIVTFSEQAMKLVQPVGLLLIHSVVSASSGASRSSRQQLFRHSAAFVSTSKKSSSKLFGKQRFSSAGNTGTYSSAVAVAMAPTAENHNKSVVEGMPEEADLDPTSAEVSVVRFPPESIRLDTYNGITLDLGNITSLANANDVHDVLVTDVPTFESALKDALIIWKAEERKGIWIRVPTNLSHVIPVSTHHKFISNENEGSFSFNGPPRFLNEHACTNLGFDFQFAEKGQLVLTKWLPTDGESRLPNGPTHQVGIGGLIFHPVTGKMLVVQEKSGPAA
eukprot:scaffold2513_cov47-Attheya_sp.AAC.5